MKRQADLVQIRPATLSDARAIAEVHIASWRAAYREILPADVLDRLDVSERARKWEEILTAGSSTTILAEDEGRPAGFASFGASRDADADSAHTAEILAVYVSPAFWGRGFGKRLCNTALSELASSGFNEVTLWVLEQNEPAIQFYRTLGFDPDGASAERTIGTPHQVLRYRSALNIYRPGISVVSSGVDRTTDYRQ